MKINVTDQTTTFPVPVAKVKGRLMDQIGMTWTTSFGKILLDVETAQWIASNAHTSMFNSDRSYVYNKALWEFYCSHNSLESLNIDAEQNIFDSIRTWAKVRGLYEKGDENTQYVKLQEEAGELAKALLKNDQPEVIDAIGDIIVVLTNLAHLRGVKIEDCIDSAYNVISKRTGKMINGTFVKDEL
jgi:NTP pyrophosphatase (non-canonical NTP hydrolase)